MGDAAVPRLLELLEDRRPTRVVGHPPKGTVVLRNCDVVLEILESLAGQKFDRRPARGAYLSTAGKAARAKIIKNVTKWSQERKNGR